MLSRASGLLQTFLAYADAAEKEADLRAAIATSERNKATAAAANNLPGPIVKSANERAEYAEKAAFEARKEANQARARIAQSQVNARAELADTFLLPGELQPTPDVIFQSQANEQAALAVMNARTAGNTPRTPTAATAMSLQTVSRELLDELQKIKTNISSIPIEGPINEAMARLTATVSTVDTKLVELQGKIEDSKRSFASIVRLQTQAGDNQNLTTQLGSAQSELEAARRSILDLKARLSITTVSRNSEIAALRTQLETSREFASVESSILTLVSSVADLNKSIETERKDIRENIQTLIDAVTTLTTRLAKPPQNDQQAEALTQALKDINLLVTSIPASISAIRISAPEVNVSPPVVNVSPPQVTVPPPNITVSTPDVKKAIDDLIALVRAGGASAIANGAGTGQVAGQDPSPPTPSDFEEKRDTAVAALQKVIAEYKNYVRNAGDAVPYLKRPYRAEVYYDSNETYDAADPSKRRFKTRGVLALVPCREFSNILATGCGAIGQAITALANARSARARAHVQHPHAALGVLRMNTVVVGHPAGPASRGVVPLDAPGHLAMALHDDIAVAEIALRQAYHELEGKLSPYEAFRVFPPGDARRYVPVPTDPTEVDDAFRRAAGLEVTLAIDRPTDVEAMFRHAASLEVTLALDRILTRVHVRSESCWPLQGVNPFDTIDALAKHVYGIITPRTQPSKETLDKERREVESLARQVAEHEERQREARIYREAREAAREAELEAARLARQARLVARV
jgi:hypothetical protein